MNKQAKIATMTAIAAVALFLAFSVFAGNKQCNNGVDDDNDGLVDYPNDPGCSTRRDRSETSTSLVCDNGVDETNDRDTLADFRLSGGDAGCTSATDSSEIDGQCDDLFDNDGDGFNDYPSDPECISFGSNEGNCVDTDGGIVFEIKGTVSGSTGGTPYNNTDTCLSSVTLKENFCSVGSPGFVNQSCANNATGCVNGACV